MGSVVAKPQKIAEKDAEVERNLQLLYENEIRLEKLIIELQNRVKELEAE